MDVVTLYWTEMTANAVHKAVSSRHYQPSMEQRRLSAGVFLVFTGKRDLAAVDGLPHVRDARLHTIYRMDWSPIQGQQCICSQWRTKVSTRHAEIRSR
jgi:hypothetical protein